MQDAESLKFASFFSLWRTEPVPDEMNAIPLQLKHEQPGSTESVSESKA